MSSSACAVPSAVSLPVHVVCDFIARNSMAEQRGWFPFRVPRRERDGTPAAARGSTNEKPGLCAAVPEWLAADPLEASRGSPGVELRRRGTVRRFRRYLRHGVRAEPLWLRGGRSHARSTKRASSHATVETPPTVQNPPQAPPWRTNRDARHGMRVVDDIALLQMVVYGV